MYVQAFDRRTEQYYKSVVYAIIKRKSVPIIDVPEHLCHREELAVLLNPISSCFELLPEYDITCKSVAGIPTLHFNPNYTIIQPQQEEWKALEENQIQQYANERVISVVGYSDVIDEPAIISKLLTDKCMDTKETGIRIRIPKDSDEWTYVLTQKDADKLVSDYDDFHDAVIDQIHYTETDTRSFMVTVALSPGNAPALQLCFEGVITLNLRTPIEAQRKMAYASLNVGNRLITWVVDESAQSLPNDETGIQALSLKWRAVK